LDTRRKLEEIQITIFAKRPRYNRRITVAKLILQFFSFLWAFSHRKRVRKVKYFTQTFKCRMWSILHM